MNSVKIGITSFAFRYRASNGSSIRELLDMATRLGAEVFQLCENTGILDIQASELTSLRSQSIALGIRLELGISGAGGQGLERAIRVADSLGVKIIRAVVDGGSITLQETVNKLEAILPTLEKEDLCLCVENHFRFTPNEVAYLVRILDHKRIRVCLDPLNSLAKLVGPEETIRLLSPYAKTAHIKDVSIVRKGAGWVLVGAPLGSGQVDLKGYLNSLPQDVESLLLESWMDPLETIEATLKQEMDWVAQGMNWIRSHRTLVGQRSRNDE